MLRSIGMQSGETVDSVPKKKKKKTATEGRTCGKGPRTQTPNTVIVWSKVDLSSIELRFYASLAQEIRHFGDETFFTANLLAWHARNLIPHTRTHGPSGRLVQERPADGPRERASHPCRAARRSAHQARVGVRRGQVHVHSGTRALEYTCTQVHVHSVLAARARRHFQRRRSLRSRYFQFRHVTFAIVHLLCNRMCSTTINAS